MQVFFTVLYGALNLGYLLPRYTAISTATACMQSILSAVQSVRFCFVLIKGFPFRSLASTRKALKAFAWRRQSTRLPSNESPLYIPQDLALR